MTTQPLPSHMYYSADLIPLGEPADDPNSLTADDEEWVNGQTYWNIFVTVTNTETGEIDEIVDLDIPVEFAALARAIFMAVENEVGACNTSHIMMS